MKIFKSIIFNASKQGLRWTVSCTMEVAEIDIIFPEFNLVKYIKSLTNTHKLRLVILGHILKKFSEPRAGDETRWWSTRSAPVPFSVMQKIN